LKLTIPETDRNATAHALDIDPLDAQIRQVVFFDTPDLQLDKAGVVVRARRVQGRGDDTTVKLRPVDPDNLRKKDRQSPNLNVEVDAMPGGYVCSASMKCESPRAEVRRVLAGEHPIRKLYSKEQRNFFEEYAPAGTSLDELMALGPITVFKLKSVPPEFGRKAVVELWQFPDRTQVIELSTRTRPGEALRVAAQARVFLSSKGISTSGDHHTKTRTALEFFTQQH
jgi:hypothetical protein